MRTISVVGITDVGLAIIERLTAAGQGVRILLPAGDADPSVEDELVGVEVIGCGLQWPRELARLQLDGCAALVLAGDDDASNVDAVLRARQRHPDVPIHVRIADESLRRYLHKSVPTVHVFSMTAAAAGPSADLAAKLLEAPRARRVFRRAQRFVRGVLPRPSQLFGSVFAAFGLILLPTVFYFAGALDIPLIDALYFTWTTVFSVGYGDYNLQHASPEAKLVGMGVMLLGAGFTAALVSLMADWLIARRLGSLFARVAVQMSNHAVIVGAGNVGARVAELLVERGHRVVVIERDAENPNIGRLRSHRIPVVLGDASVRDVLDQASSFDAGVVMALTERDAVNLHIGLTMDEADDDVPVIVRLLSPELTQHVQRTSQMHAISPVAAAADAVCALLIEEHAQERVDVAASAR